MTGISKPI